MARIGSMRVKYDAILRDESGRFISEVQAGSENAVQELADNIERNAQALAPAGATGELKRSFRQERVSSTRITVVNDAPHASSIERGARAHRIPGGFGKEAGIQHPGIRPGRRFMERAGNAVAVVSAAVIKRNLPNL